MNNGVGLLLFFLLIVIPAIVLIVVFSVIKQRRKDFVLQHSIAIRQLIHINKKYQFYEIGQITVEHHYDNIDFYTDISPIDYLVYELSNHEKYYDLMLKESIQNEKYYFSYLNEKKKISNFGIYDIEQPIENIEKLNNIENDLFIKYIKSAPEKLNIKVILYLTNINGDEKDKKHQEFTTEDIAYLMKEIKKRNGSFYLNQDVWDCICKVERGKVSNRLRFAIYKRDGNRCRYCGSTHNLEIDHIKPIAKGGKTTFDNLQTLCKRCNQNKSDYY